ncbi:MAG: ribonuclease HI [Odoribacteraceae bacterium]|jgi:ribonuclease HI|nr:ribonuclease HI [Odoribacteraceae bacterium]
MNQRVIIYTDGSSRGNPGPGGHAAILTCGPHRKEISQGYRQTTNNRMELLAVISALETLRRPDLLVDVYTDSRYVIDPVQQGWLFTWERNHFKNKKNPDLWQRFLPLYRAHRVTFHWVPGHSNIPLNEQCDRLAVAASRSPDLQIDFYHEDSQDFSPPLLPFPSR